MDITTLAYCELICALSVGQDFASLLSDPWNWVTRVTC